MDQEEGAEQPADRGLGEETQAAALPAEKEGEPGEPAPTAEQVRVSSHSLQGIVYCPFLLSPI